MLKMANQKISEFALRDIGKLLSITFNVTVDEVNASVASLNGESFAGNVFRVDVTPSVSVPEIKFNPDNVDRDKAERLNYLKLLQSNANSLTIICKSAPSSVCRRKLFKTRECFEREIYVYEKLLPEFHNFQQKRLLPESQNGNEVENAISSSVEIFDNYPHLFSFSMENNEEFILIDDLCNTGYGTLCRQLPISYNDCKIVLRKLAHFHAISFAMREKEPEHFKTVTSQLQELLFVRPVHQPFETFLKNTLTNALKSLELEPQPGDESVRKALLKFRDNFHENMINCVSVKDHTVVCHGDCWISNLMFREDKNKNSREIKFVDWQLTRTTSPVIDLSYLLFCCTDSVLRRKLPELLQYYYECLVNRIDELGCVGRDLFPYVVFMEHMKKYSQFGLGMAAMTLHSTLCPSEDLPDVVAVLDTFDYEKLEQISMHLHDRPQYMKRISGVFRDMVNLGYITE